MNVPVKDVRKAIAFVSELLEQPDLMSIFEGEIPKLKQEALPPADVKMLDTRQAAVERFEQARRIAQARKRL